MVTDPISDLIVRIKNGSDAKKESISIPYSALKEAIAHTLAKGGYLGSVEKKGKQISKTLEVSLVYHSGEPRVHGVQRVSKPSRRIYQKARDIRVFRSGYGSVVLSTPKGIMLDSDARKTKVGGEVLFKIW
jgi:small subunit ribosomal protein S8